jgi:hypothetical protein
MLRSRPAKYHFLIPPNTPDAIRLELEQRQRPVSITNKRLIFSNFIDNNLLTPPKISNKTEKYQRLR